MTLPVFALIGLVAGLWIFTVVQSRRIATRYPPRGRRIDIGEGAIHVLDRRPTGAERGAIMLIHGASGNSADLAIALMDRLCAEGFRVLSVDRPGHGWSDRIGGREAFTPARQASALRRAAESIGVSRAIVAAHSLGGITALAMALEEPDFVQALVLIAPVSHPWPGGVAWYYSLGAHSILGAPFRGLATLPVGMARISAAVAGVFAPNSPPPNFVEATMLPLVLRPAHFRANCEDVVHAEAAVAAMSPRYGEIRAPTEIVTGDSDGVVYAQIHSAGLARDITFSRLTTLQRTGHSPHHVAPDRIVNIILEAAKRSEMDKTEQVLALIGPANPL